MSFPRYPKYKPSGVEWLGEVPEHWSVKPLKYLAGIDSCGSYGVEPDAAEFVLPVATTAQIDTAGQFGVERMPLRGFTPLEVQRYGCSAGDILVVKSSGSATNIISGKVGLVDELTPSFVFSNFLMRVRPVLRHALPKFIYALLSSNLTRQRVELMCSTTTYPNLQIADYTSAPLPIPPLAEQTAIAEFLDRETGKIDGLVAEQRRLMELLKEKRQAIISHAVTKGLNPHAPMKPSGIEWLGDVPVGWVTCALKRLVRMQSGESITAESIAETGAYPVYGGNGLRGFTSEFTHDGTYVLIGRQGALCGNINYAYEKFWASEHAVVATPTRPIDTFWLGEMLRTMNLNQYSIAAAQPGLSVELVGKLGIPVPPLAEQKAIAAYLTTETAKFDTLTAEAQRAIDLLQERRTALISAAVTGQIDVRVIETREFN